MPETAGSVAGADHLPQHFRSRSSAPMAVLGIIHAMGALDQGPEVLGGLIGAALVGTFSGIFASMASSSRSPTRSS